MFYYMIESWDNSDTDTHIVPETIKIKKNQLNVLGKLYCIHIFLYDK